MTSKSHEKFIDAYDTLTARLAQAQGLLASLRAVYTDQPTGGVRHRMDAGSVRDALWGLSELLEQADEAAVVGLGGCSFVPKASGAA